MTTAIETGTRRIFQTQARTDYGLADFWLDGSLGWHVDVDDAEFSKEIEDFSWELVGTLLDHQQQERAIEATEEYLSVEFRAMNEILKKTDAAGSAEWLDTFTRLGEMYRGLHIFQHRINMVNDDIEDRDVGFDFEPRRFLLDEGRRNFELHGLTHWFETGVGGPEGVEIPQMASSSLAEVAGYASGVARDEVIAAHLDLLEHYAAHLRFLINKIRAGAAVSQSEIARIGHWGTLAAVLSQELDSLT